MATEITNGGCASGFGAVREVFTRSIEEGRELGAAVCVYLDGVKVVDLWGGHFDKDKSKPWERDTIVCMMSVSKGISALCCHLLVERGLLELSAPVSDYWPEFAQAGKEGTTVKQLLSHHAGLLFPDLAPEGSLFDWEAMTDALARQEPEWPVGTRGAYHSCTYGFFTGELVRRIAGVPLDEFWQCEIAEKLGLDYHFGVPRDDHGRISDILPNPKSVTLSALDNSESKIARAWRPRPAIPDFFNSAEFREALLPSGSGHGNARAVGKLFGALATGGEIDGVRVFAPETIDAIRQEQWAEICGQTDRFFRMGVGLFLNSPKYMPMGPNPDSFGHAGAGGSIGFADPVARLGFSYCTNLMCAGDGIGGRCESLIEATYRCLER